MHVEEYPSVISDADGSKSRKSSRNIAIAIHDEARDMVRELLEIYKEQENT